MYCPNPSLCTTGFSNIYAILTTLSPYFNIRVNILHIQVNSVTVDCIVVENLVCNWRLEVRLSYFAPLSYFASGI